MVEGEKGNKGHGVDSPGWGTACRRLFEAFQLKHSCSYSCELGMESIYLQSQEVAAPEWIGTP